jgi:hypothetical protein
VAPYYSRRLRVDRSDGWVDVYPLKRDANRFRGLYGAARAAEAAGNIAVAREHYAKLQQLTAERELERPELAHAKAFLASR